MRGSLLLRLLATLVAGTTCCVAADEPPRLAVLDIEILGDLDARRTSEYDARRRAASMRLREELQRSGLYEVVDNAGASDLIERLSAVQYLHKCNGCELDIGRELGTEYVLVAWVNRVSALVLSLNYEIRDVESGAAVRRRAFDFRGDNQEAWNRAVTYLVDYLKARAAGEHTPPRA